MNFDIKVTTTTKSTIEGVDFDNIPFGKIYSDHMFVVDYVDGAWRNPEIKPLAPMSIHPGNLAWHYGQSIFEGMKATKGKNGTPLLFRTQKHIERINASAQRMCMPTIPGDLFLEGLRKLVQLDKDWIPEKEGSALYIRPLMMAMDAAIGVRPSETYRFVIMTLPVGPYYPKPVKLLASTKYIRACAGGVGEAKTAGNYAASLYPAKMAKEEGYDQMLWLDGLEFKYIQEVGTMNIFFVIDNEVITPALNGAILKGITRSSIIDILRSKGYTVTERPISIDEVYAAYREGKLQEVFGSGTAAVVSEVEEIKWKNNVMQLNPEQYTVSKLAKSYINGIRNQKIDDVFGWMEPIEESVTV